MIIDNQINRLNCDITANFLDIYFDENNNSFSNNMDNRTASNSMSNGTFNLPDPIFSIKTMPKLVSVGDENEMSFKLSKQLTKQSVKRALFVEKDEIDHEANLKLVRKQLEQIEKEDCERWNFDFKNNRPLNNLNSRYEWFIGEPVLNKLDLNASSSLNTPSISETVICNTTSNTGKLSNISNADKIESSSSSTTSNIIATRSLKRKLNIIDYFQPAKKRVSCLLKDTVKSNDAPLPISKSTGKKAELKDSMLKYQPSKQQPIKPLLKRKCKKSRAPSTQQRCRPKKSKSLEKVKRQTTLKF